MKDVFLKLFSSADKEFNSDLESTSRNLTASQDNLSNTSNQFKNAPNNQNTFSVEKNIKLIKEEVTIKLLLQIFTMHFEKIESSGLPLISIPNQNNKVNNTNLNPRINANYNQQFNDKIIKLSNEMIVCIFKGINYFSTKYLIKSQIALNYFSEIKSDNYKNNSNFNSKFIGGVEDEKYFASKAELNMVYKILLIMNKYNFLKAKLIPILTSNLSPRNTISENTPNLNTLSSTNPSFNLNTNLNIPIKNSCEPLNQIPNQQSSLKANYILQKLLLKYSSDNKPNNFNNQGKLDYLDEILDNIEIIIKNFEIIIFSDILEKIANKNKSPKDLFNNDFKEISKYYLEIFNFLKTLSNNSGLTLLLIKNGIYLFVLYFITKYNSKSFINDNKMKDFLNEISESSYFILKNLITHVHSFSKNQTQRGGSCSIVLPVQQTSANQNINHYFGEEQINTNINNVVNLNNLKSQKSEKFDPALLNTSLNSKSHEFTFINKLHKIFNVFEKVIKNLLQNYFYELILNPISTTASKELGAIIKLENITPESQCIVFLKCMKSSIETPDFIWNKNYRKEMKSIIYRNLMKLNQNKFQVNFSLFSMANNFLNLNMNNNTPPQNLDNTEAKNQQNLSTLTKLNSNSSIINNVNYINYENKSDYEVINLEHLENLQIFEYISSRKELKIGKIYIRVYNKNYEFKLENPNQFLEALKQNLLDIEYENFNYKDYFESLKRESKIEKNSRNNNFNSAQIPIKDINSDIINDSNLEQNPNKNENEIGYFSYDENLKLNINVIDELLKAISNVINYSKADETILLNDSIFVEKFYKLLNENINYNSNIKEKLKESMNEKNDKNLANTNLENTNKDRIFKSPMQKGSGPVNIFINFKSNLNKKIRDSNLEIDRENIFTLLNINLNYQSSEFFEEDFKIIDLIPSCLNLLYILSMINPESMKFVLNHNIIFIILKIINNYNTKSHIDPIIRILRLINKNPEYVDKLNISIFLFLLKKIVSFRDLTLYILEEEKVLNRSIEKITMKLKTLNSQDKTLEDINTNNIKASGNNKIKISEYFEKVKLLKNQMQILKETYAKIQQLGIDIIKIIKKFINNERIGFAIKGIFEFYLPNKIINSLFLSKETNESSIKCLGEELELPDLIWNKEAIQQSKKILDEDTIFILNDEINLDNFPLNLISHKLLPQKCFFFEISDEYRLDNIYIRIFNKDPSYNLGKNLVIFLKQIFCDCLNNYKKLKFFDYLQNNKPNKNNINLDNEKTEFVNKELDMNNNDLIISGKSNNLIIASLKNQILCGFTAILLIIEQINFNDFNDNLGISSVEEMKNLVKDENEKNLISLVQRSFEYQNLISETFIRKLTNLILYSFAINDNEKKINLKALGQFLCFSDNLRFIYLQIFYLLCVNKKAINIIYNMIDINGLLEKFYEIEEQISDGKFFYKLNLFSKSLLFLINY